MLVILLWGFRARGGDSAVTTIGKGKVSGCPRALIQALSAREESARIEAINSMKPSQ